MVCYLLNTPLPHAVRKHFPVPLLPLLLPSGMISTQESEETSIIVKQMILSCYNFIIHAWGSLLN